MGNQQPSPEQGKVQRLLCTPKWVETEDAERRRYSLIRSETCGKTLDFYNNTEYNKQNNDKNLGESMEKRGAFKNVSDEELIELYINQNLSTLEMAEHYSVTVGAIRTCLSRRGIHKAKEQISSKNKELLEKKYGVTSTLLIPEVQDKIKKTCLEKYGNSDVRSVGGIKSQEKISQNPLASDLRKARLEKARNTTLKKYGVPFAAKNPSVRARMRHQWRINYGVDNPMSSAELRRKMQNTVRERYGVDNIMQLESTAQKTFAAHRPNYPFELLNNKNQMLEYLEQLSEPVTINELTELLGEVNYVTVQQKLKSWGLSRHRNIEFAPNHSKLEARLMALFISWGVRAESRRRDIIPPYEIDIWLPDLNLGVEVNGNYWHSEKNVPFRYHQEKAKLAEANGVRLCQFFEYELQNPRMWDKICSYLKDICGVGTHAVYARQCEVRHVEAKERKCFLEAYHLQGAAPCSTALGLYYNGELVSLMTFGRPRFNREVDWELVRFCSKAGYRVIGGASKLFNAFVRSDNVQTGQIVLSYSDYTRTSGKVYEAIGFQLRYIAKPNYVWCKNQDVQTRYQCQMKNESRVMRERGYYKIFDAGNKVWVYIVDK